METTNKASITVTSIIAIIAAVLSFKSGAVLGFIFAGVAFVFGILGVLQAQSSKKRGGVISLIAIFMSVIGVIAAVVKFILWLL